MLLYHCQTVYKENVWKKKITRGVRKMIPKLKTRRPSLINAAQDIVVC